MKKREANEKVVEFIGETATKIRTELEEELKMAKTQMINAETKLLKGLTEEQKQLYADVLKFSRICDRIETDLGKK